jgi:hypothetical protein
MKQDFFTAPGLRIQRQVDKWNGPMYLAWKPNVSMCFRDRKALLKFCNWPPKTPTGDRLREWLNSFDETTDTSVPTADTSLSSELLTTGFGPECHDVDNDNTRTVI